MKVLIDIPDDDYTAIRCEGLYCIGSDRLDISVTTAFQNAVVYEENPNKWIPVSKGLPERYKEVIVTDIETSDTYLSRYIGNGYWECDNGLSKNRIIAWQPKPEPYKPDKEVNG